jgi:hypothetical protein
MKKKEILQKGKMHFGWSSWAQPTFQECDPKLKTIVETSTFALHWHNFIHTNNVK